MPSLWGLLWILLKRLTERSYDNIKLHCMRVPDDLSKDAHVFVEVSHRSEQEAIVDEIARVSTVNQLKAHLVRHRALQCYAAILILGPKRHCPQAMS